MSAKFTQIIIGVLGAIRNPYWHTGQGPIWKKFPNKIFFIHSNILIINNYYYSVIYICISNYPYIYISVFI